MEDNVTRTRPTHRWRRPAVLIGLAALLAGAGGLVWAAGFGPGGIGLHGHMDGMVREHVEFRVHRALARVNASDAQEEQVLAILDRLFDQHKAHEAEHKELHDRALTALTADPVDRAALEAVRVEAIQRFDEGSVQLVDAVADMAEVLTPAQRQQLAEAHRERFE
jgi:periplasmic protein CpxP/Spy